jgi:pyrroloquinoline quinone biosynthesis protein E
VRRREESEVPRPEDRPRTVPTVPGAFERVELREIDLNITNRCNLQCVHCAFASGGGDTSELSVEVIERLVVDAKRLGCREIHLTGGEPTVHREFERVLETILGAGLFTRLISNGVVAAGQLRRMRTMGLGHVLFSLDGLGETHDRIRGKAGAFAVTCQRVEQAIGLGFHVRVNAVAMRENLHDIVPLYDWCAAVGVPLFSVFLYSPTGRDRSSRLDAVVDPFAWRDVKRALAERCRGRSTEVFVEMGFWFPDEPEPDWAAMAGRGGGCSCLASVLDYLLITGDGQVFPCALLNDKGIPYGNIHQRPLSDIIARPDPSYLTYLAFREPPAACAACPGEPKCHGGCRAFSFAFHGEWTRQDPRCQWAAEAGARPFLPLCPLFKENLSGRRSSGFSEHVS